MSKRHGLAWLGAVLLCLICVTGPAQAAEPGPQAAREYRLRHIVAKSQGEAQAIIVALEAGNGPFATWASKLSRDASTAKEGGELGWLQLAFLPPAISTALLTHTAPGLLPEPVETPLGWHVIEIEAIRDAAADCDFDCTVQRHLAAIDARDWPAYEATLAHGETLSLVMPNGRFSSAGAAFRKQMQAWFADSDWRWQHAPLHRQLGKDWGMVLLKVAYEDKDEQGKPYQLDYLLQLLFERQPDGWKLVHDQNTMMPRADK
ncbi:peptidylprolyl isomerase [Chitinimonas sp.]|uniref:peptidylprolyl isomerase n=1 Tax=Chitinimonas sp. TaxID=1934313 RepID=UPI002F95C1CF